MTKRVGQYLGAIGTGGIEHVVFSWLTHSDMNRFKWDIIINKPQTSQYDGIMREYNVDLKVLQDSEPSNKIKNLYAKYTALYRFLKKEKYDIFHIHGSYSSILVFALIAKLAGIKCCLVHAHANSFSPKNSRLSVFYYKLLKMLLSCVPDGYLACSESAGKWMFGNKKISVVNNGIDVDRFINASSKRSEMRRKLRIDDKDIIIGHAGRLVVHKNQSFLIKLVHHMNKIYEKNYKLVLIGDGDDKQMLVDKVKTLGESENVIFTGNVDNIEDYYAAMDVFVFPSLAEGLGITLIEAQAAGLPVLASDVIVDEACITSLVTKKSLNDSIESWAETVNEICGKHIDEKNRRAAIYNAGFDIASASERLTDLYEEMIK